MDAIRVQTGKKFDYAKVQHDAIVQADGTIVTACGAGAKAQTFYTLQADEFAGPCHRCHRINR